MFNKRNGVVALCGAVLSGLSLHAVAQVTEDEATIAAYAAGYQANFTCSAVFNANKATAAIAEHELTGIYPLVQDQVTASVAADNVEINREQAYVAVPYRDDMPPRYSLWRPRLGCVDLPVGASLADAEQVPGGTAFADGWQAPTADNGEPWQQRAEVNAKSANAALEQVIQQAFSTHYGAGARTSAVLIATPSDILLERYIDGFSPITSQRTWSVAKSIGASVVGVAVARGLLDVKAPAALDNWSQPLDPRRHITTEQLLHMASGLDSNAAGNRTDRLYMGGGAVANTATQTALEVIPGSRWKYANNDTLLALRAVRERFDHVEDYLAFPFEALLDKIGMQHTFLETDWQGDFILSSQVWTTSRDLARLGVLHLQNGRWNNEQILPQDWLAYVSRPAPVQPPRQNRAGEPTPGYGAQWWLFDAQFAGIPADTIAARGNRGQFLLVIPSLDLVVVRRGYDMAGQPGFNDAAFIRDVVAALAIPGEGS